LPTFFPSFWFFFPKPRSQARETLHRILGDSCAQLFDEDDVPEEEEEVPGQELWTEEDLESEATPTAQESATSPPSAPASDAAPATAGPPTIVLFFCYFLSFWQSHFRIADVALSLLLKFLALLMKELDIGQPFPPSLYTLRRDLGLIPSSPFFFKKKKEKNSHPPAPPFPQVFKATSSRSM
jgi:hypothetical protein